MRTSNVLLLCVAMALLVTVAGSVSSVRADDLGEREWCEKRVRPLLLKKWARCHGAKKQRAGLRLDTPAGIAAGSDTGLIVVPGNADESRLIEVIRYTGEIKMPPRGKLAESEIAALVRWVNSGALTPRVAIAPRRERATDAPLFTKEERSFWAFQPIQDPRPPRVDDSDWPRSPLDRFILARLEAEKIRPAPPADKRTLIRRATFDLTGLPPTPEEIDAFVMDASSNAFEKVVDRLLASPRYGERWGRHWLDVARYADSNGLDENQVHANAFRYRDYVVSAFNKDKPYDRFVREQLAGDLLGVGDDANVEAELITATGFLVLGPKSLAEVDETKMGMDIIDEQVDSVGKAFLAMTLGCARCHNHKFDPFPTQDYYSLAGIFGSTTTITKYQGPGDSKRGRWLERELSKDPAIHAMAVQDGDIFDFRVHVRGSHLSLGEEVPRRFPRILAGEEQTPIDSSESGRRALALWLTQPAHPLTSRVIVNRIWAGHFGAGIVRTPDNFGRLGERPTHPLLLDWLARRFTESGWSIKQLHRRIMLASTYRMSSFRDPQSVEADPENLLYWRVPRRRLEVEAIRDSLLVAGGLLELKQGGSLLTIPNRKYTVDTTTFRHLVTYDSHRRSIYLPVIRNIVYDFFQAFDFPDPSVVNGKRATTTVASQALFLMNSPLVMECAYEMAQRLLAASEMDDAARVDRAYKIALGRSPDPGELVKSLAFLKRYERVSKAVGSVSGASEPRLDAWRSFCHALMASNEFVHLD